MSSSKETSVTRANRQAALARILEAFAATLDLDEVLQRVVNITLEAFGADRVWLMFPMSETAERASLSLEAARAGFETSLEVRSQIPLEPSRQMIRATLEAGKPTTLMMADRRGNPEARARLGIRSAMFQILRPSGQEEWGFAVHQCSRARKWTALEQATFEEIGRYATLAINNAQTHRHAAEEAAKVNAILDQIPAAAAIFDAQGKLLRMNEAGLRERALLWELDPEGRIHKGRARTLDGKQLKLEELPSLRALHGETIKGDYIFSDPRSQEDRMLNIRAAPIKDAENKIMGSVLLASDVTEERQKIEQDLWRRRRAECLASLSLLTASGDLSDLNSAAEAISKAVLGNSKIFIYRPQTDHLELAGASFHDRVAGERFRAYLQSHPFKPGEGLAGTVFALGKPLMFSEVTTAAEGMRRDKAEASLSAAVGEESLIAHPIEAYGQRLGVVVLSHGDPRRRFGAEDLAFAQAVADRIGSAMHATQLSRFAHEGHRAAEELARREVDARARLEAVLESAPIGVAVISADELRFEMANPLWTDFASRYGKVGAEDPIVGLRVSEVIPFLERQLQNVAEKGEVRVDDEVEVRSGRSVSYFKRIISPVQGRFSGITQSLTVLLQDVTEQVRTRREIEALVTLLEERTARLDSIIGSMTDALWVYDAAQNVVDVNPAALALLGLASRGDAVNHGSLRAMELRYPDGRTIPPEEMPYARALRGDVVPDFLAVAKNLITGRDVDLSIAAAPIESGSVVGAVLVMRDITALQELDRKKDEFLSVASHELRTPLTTVKGYSQLLSQSVNDLDPEERLTYLHAILGEVDRMMGLITELLDVSRIETNRLMLDRQDVEWKGLIEKQAENFRVQNPKRRIVFNFAAQEVRLQVDPLRMRQVIDNLLSNAIKYSPETSEIEIGVSLEGDAVRTSVKDFGIGIPRDEINQLFERFHRARNVSSRYYGGLGLGLYIARAIVEAHGGRMMVVSEEGKGSTFTLVLPRKVTAPVAPVTPEVTAS